MLPDGGRLLAQGRYREADALVSRMTAVPGTRAAGWILAIRGALGRGRFRAATDLANSIPRANVGPLLDLWIDFAGMFGDGGLSQRVPATLVALARHVDRDDLTGLVARDLSLRARLIAIQVGELSRDEQEPVARRLGPIAAEYQARGLRTEAFDAWQRQSHAYLVNPATRAPAVPLLETARATAARLGEPLYEGEAALTLAGLRLEEALERDGVEDLYEGDFDAAGGLLVAGGHAYGAARAAWALAGTLLRYGRPDGAGRAAWCLDAFTRAGVDHLAAEVSRAVLIHATRRGDGVTAARLAETAQDASAADTAGLRAVVEALTAGDAALRDGHAGLARELLDRTLAEAPHRVGRISLRVVLASTLGLSGLEADARAVLRDALDDRPEIGPTVATPEVLALLATFEMSEDPQAALELLDRAVAVARELGTPVDEGRFLTQAMWHRGHARIAAGLPPLDDVADGYHRQALAVLTGTRTLDARQALTSAYQMRGQLAFITGDWSTCLECYVAAEETSRRAGLAVDLAHTLQHQALVLVEVGRRTDISAYDTAIGCLAEATAIFRTARMNGMVWRTVWLQGVCDQEAARRVPDQEAASARRARAMQRFETAAATLDLLRGAADHGSGLDRQRSAMAFTVDKQQAYRSGLKLAIEELGDPALGLRWLERMKSVALLDALVDLAVPPAVPGARDLLAEERALYDRKAAAVSFDELADLQRGIDDVLSRMAALPVTRGYATLRRPTAPGWPDVRAMLAAEDGTIGDGHRLVVAEYFYEGPTVFLIGMRSDWVSPRVAPVGLDVRAFEEFVGGTLRQPDGVRRHLRTDDATRAWEAFAELVRPLADWTEPDDVVCLIPYGTLHDLPLHALPVSGTALAERNPVFYAPSLAVLHHVLSRPGRASGRVTGAVVLGDPDGGLPRARAEAEEIARLLGAEPPLLGSRVDRESVLSALAGRDIVHIAGHAEASARDGFEASIDLAGGERLRAAELLTAPVRARLVVLSGCESGVSQRRPGDELVGLVRALLHAGAGCLLTSLWQIDDITAGRLLTSFYRAYVPSGTGAPAVRSHAHALRDAMRSVRGLPGRHYVYHWAGFVLVGDWR